jgi:hypothetical protein
MKVNYSYWRFFLDSNDSIFNEWIDGLCGKKNRIKCSRCKNQKFIGLDVNTLIEHFKGKETLGLYPID